MSKIAVAQGRSVEEWVGSTPDAKIPPRVLLRIFDRANGICHITGRKITPADKWQAEHIVALADGGEHRESNLAPALEGAHKVKSSEEAAIRAAVRARRKSHIGARVVPVKPLEGAGFPISAKTAKRLAREPRQTLPPRQLFK